MNVKSNGKHAVQYSFIKSDVRTAD